MGYNISNGDVFALIGMVGVSALIYGWRVLSSGGKDPKTSRFQDPVFTPGEKMPPGMQLHEQKVTLRYLSRIWGRGEIIKLQFDELSHIWREKEPREEDKKRVPEFTRPEIIKFFRDRIDEKPWFENEALSATIDLLELLDKLGGCPSVVNLNPSEPEKAYDPDTYNVLAKVPLYIHSLHVACEAMDRVGEGPVIPKAALAGLAHDLGKMPHYYGKFYKTATHPAAGLSVAETVKSLKNIKWFDEIASSIIKHHIQSTGYLDNLIRESDQAARRFEMNTNIAEEMAATTPVAAKDTSGLSTRQCLTAEAAESTPVPAKVSEADPKTSELDVHSREEPGGVLPEVRTRQVEVQAEAVAEEALSVVEPVAAQFELAEKKAEKAVEETPPAVKTGAEQTEGTKEKTTSLANEKVPEVKPWTPLHASAPVEPERQDRQRVSRQLKDISGWFDADLFVADLAEIINAVTSGDRFWSALALGGYVYVKPSGFYKLMIRHSKSDPAVMAAETSEQDKDDYLYSVVMALKSRKDLIATEFLPAGKFGAVFYHNPGPDGTGPKQFLIPFRADYFGEVIGRLEGRRTVLMKKTKELKVAFKTGGN